MAEQIPILSGKSPYRASSDVSDTTCDPTVESLEDGDRNEIKVYRRRWIVLAIFVSDVVVNLATWISFGPIAEIARCYYGVTDFWINSLSTVYMLSYTVLLLPGVWMLARLELQTTAVIASCCSAAGACLKVAGVGE